jgi:putative addiction module CopG family antidote
MPLSISLPPELEGRILEYVASGQYGSATEVIQEALQLLDSHHAARTLRFARLKEDIGDIKREGRRRSEVLVNSARNFPYLVGSDCSGLTTPFSTHPSRQVRNFLIAELMCKRGHGVHALVPRKRLGGDTV